MNKRYFVAKRYSNACKSQVEFILEPNTIAKYLLIKIIHLNIIVICGIKF